MVNLYMMCQERQWPKTFDFSLSMPQVGSKKGKRFVFIHTQHYYENQTPLPQIQPLYLWKLLPQLLISEKWITVRLHFQLCWACYITLQAEVLLWSMAKSCTNFITHMWKIVTCEVCSGEGNKAQRGGKHCNCKQSNVEQWRNQACSLSHYGWAWLDPTTFSWLGRHLRARALNFHDL